MEIDLPIDVIDILFSDIERLKMDLTELSKKYMYVGTKAGDSRVDDGPMERVLDDGRIGPYVYTDGSAINNGGITAVGGSGVWFGENHPYNISVKLNGKCPTNQRAELNAINLALEVIHNELCLAADVRNDSDVDVTIVSDSLYAINVLTKQWKAKDNLDLVEKGWDLIKKCKGIKFQHVKAHTSGTDIHSVGNRGADKLANAAYR